MEKEKFNQKMNQIVNSVNDKWSKDLKIRYLYRKLASLFQRDIEYFLASYEEQLIIYPEKLEINGENVVCKSICLYYKRALWRKKIKSKIIDFL